MLENRTAFSSGIMPYLLVPRINIFCWQTANLNEKKKKEKKGLGRLAVQSNVTIFGSHRNICLYFRTPSKYWLSEEKGIIFFMSAWSTNQHFKECLFFQPFQTIKYLSHYIFAALTFEMVYKICYWYLSFMLRHFTSNSTQKYLKVLEHFSKNKFILFHEVQHFFFF